jgi:hypothetical protein
MGGPRTVVEVCPPRRVQPRHRLPDTTNPRQESTASRRHPEPASLSLSRPIVRGTDPRGPEAIVTPTCYVPQHLHIIVDVCDTVVRQCS